MFLKILKKDLKRNKTLNVILFLFIIMATVFVSSGLNNLVSVMNGTEYYLDKAGVGDYIMLVSTQGDNKPVLEVLDDAKSVKGYRADEVSFISGDMFSDMNGEKYDSNTVLLQSIDRSSIKFFNKDNEECTSVKKGHVYITSSFMKDNNLKAGDKIHLSLEGVEKDFIIDGKLKDALLGSNFMGNARFIINDEDLKDFEGIDKFKKIQGLAVCIDTDDIKNCKSELIDIKGKMFEVGRDTIVMLYVLDMFAAFIVIILSVCLIIVAFVILRFSIGFTIQDDFREIGVMKAVGIKNSKIRSIYMVKYTSIAIASTLIGLLISYPFGNLLMKSVTDNMMLGSSYGMFLNIIGAIIVLLVIIGFAYICTGKLKKMSPVAAIRSGDIGERFNKKRGIRITRMKLPNIWYLSVNDIISSPKRFLNIIISFGICALFVLIMSNTTATMDSDVFIDTLALEADLYVNSPDIPGNSDEYMFSEDGRERYLAYLESVKKILKDNGYDAQVSNDVLYGLNFEYNGKMYSETFFQAINYDGGYVFEKGSAPSNKNEIAITEQITKEIGLKIGDTILLDYGDHKEECIVTATYQTMNSMGKVIRLHEDAPTSFMKATGYGYISVKFLDNPTSSEIEKRKGELKEILRAENVFNAREFCVETMNALDAMKALEILLIMITLVVIALVTIMMERSFISDEKRQIALLKSIGFTDKAVIAYHVVRFSLVSIIAVLIAMALSVPFTKLCMTPIFAMMGAMRVDFVYNLNGLLKYPVIIVVATAIVAFLTSLYTKTIRSTDTASIE